MSTPPPTHTKVEQGHGNEEKLYIKSFFCFRLKSKALMGFGVVSVFGNCLFSLGPVSAGGGIGSIQSLQSNETDCSFSFSPVPPTNNRQTTLANRINSTNDTHTPLQFHSGGGKLTLIKGGGQILKFSFWNVGWDFRFSWATYRLQKWLRTEATRHAMLPFWKPSST